MMAKTFIEDTEATSLSFEYLWARRVTMEYTFGSFATSNQLSALPPFSLLSLPWLAAEKAVEVLSRLVGLRSGYGQVIEGAHCSAARRRLKRPQMTARRSALSHRATPCSRSTSLPACRSGSTAIDESSSAIKQLATQHMSVDEMVRQLERDRTRDKLEVLVDEIKDELAKLRSEMDQKLRLVLERAGTVTEGSSAGRSGRIPRAAVGMRSSRSGEAEAPPRKSPAPPRRSIDGFLSAVSTVEVAPSREHLAA